MKLERISQNKIKYSIAFDELTDKGFLQEDLLQESFIWDVLFDEMLEAASQEYNLETFGTVSVEIFSLTSKELVLILTLEEEESNSLLPIQHEAAGDHNYLICKFDDFDNVVYLCARLKTLKFLYGNSSLYSYRRHYFLEVDVLPSSYEGLKSLCTEYGEISGISEAVLAEYGKLLIKHYAIPDVQTYF